MSTNIANFASCLGKYDGSTLYGAGTTLDPSAIAIGNSDLSLNSGYLSNPNAFTTPAIGDGTGFSVTGWFNPGGAQASNFTPLFDMSGTVGTSVTVNPFTINPTIAGWNAVNGDISGTATATANGTTYRVFSFRNGPAPSKISTTTNSYTLTYTCNIDSSINVLIVGGGGSGGSGSTVCAGGGAGGVIMKSILIPADASAQTMTIKIGAGGLGGACSLASANGSNSSITFIATGNAAITSPPLTSSALTAYGGGYGAYSDGGGKTANSGGSGGGGGRGLTGQTAFATGAASLGNATGTTLNLNYNYGNAGGSGIGTTSGDVTAGGGGAGGVGKNAEYNGSILNSNTGAGGPGIQCLSSLAGIYQFTPSGTAYGTYYWGGGGGGGSNGVVSGPGGLGGGGGQSGYSTPNGGSAITTVSVNSIDGAPNSGGGGGGTWIGNVGSGGSGIVVIAFPTSPITIGNLSPSATTLCVSGNSVTPSLVGNFNNQGTITVASGINANAWNFFGYTVCCSGATQLVQNLTVNGTTTSLTGGTYSALAVANTYVGYGLAPFNNYFNGKIDDFRYYGRVLCPMEMRVLYSYAYGKSVGASGIGGTVTKITPILGGTVTVGTLTATTAPLIFPSTGTYSYLGVTRNFAGVTTSFNVSPSLMVLSGSNYVWTDTVAFTSSPSVYYVFTPYILGSPGVSQALTATIPAPSAISSVLAYNAGIGVFDVSWIGGVGIGVTYTYDVSNSGAIVASGNYTTTALGTINPTRITLSNSAQKAYTVVVTATNGVGTVSSNTSGLITTASPNMLPFTTYSSSTTSTAFTLPNGIYTTNNKNGSVAVDGLQTKMLIATLKGLFYATWNTTNSSWNTPVLLGSLGTTPNYNNCVISADGTRGVAASYSGDGNSYYINWSSDTPTMTSFDTSTKSFYNLSMTPDGSMIISNNGTTLYYSKWNGSTYGTWTSGTGTSHAGCALSPNGLKALYGFPWGVYYTAYNGTTTWTTGVSTGIPADNRGMCFLGGGHNGTPSYFMCTVATKQGGVSGLTGSTMQLLSWNNTTNTLSNPIQLLTLTADYTNLSFTPCGSKGNIIYYIDTTTSSTSFSIKYITLNVT